MSKYSFAKMTHLDLPLFRNWLTNPHIEGWWGESNTEARLVESEFDRDLVDMRIVSYEGRPFAFIQDYNAHAFGAPQYHDQPPDARALDTFLGEPAFLGKGHGAGYIKARAHQLLQSASCVLVDPDPQNHRAIAAYQRAGFQAVKRCPSEDGDDVLVMIAE